MPKTPIRRARAHAAQRAAKTMRPAQDQTTNPALQPAADAKLDPASGPAPEPATRPTRAVSKRAAVIALLGRAEGASMTELTQATAWQPHSIRAFITGLRKAGNAILRSRRNGESRYRIGEQD